MNEPTAMDAIDKRILRIIQKDASLATREIAAQVGLSQPACWKRLQRLDASGVIKRRIALLDPLKVGLGLTAFVSVPGGRSFRQGNCALRRRNRRDGRSHGVLSHGG